MKRKITFPRLGVYTDLFGDMLKELGFDVVVPPPTSESTIKWGCKHSSDMMCFPYKVTLGNIKEALDNGANTVLMWDNKGQCRLRHYWVLHEHVLRESGYRFEMHPVKFNIFFTLKKINPRLSYFRLFRVLRKYLKKMKKMDRQRLVRNGMNIGIIGEIYTCIEPAINSDVIGKIKKLEANVYNTVTIYGFLEEQFWNIFGLNFTKRKYMKKAKKYLNGPLGGHGLQNIAHLLWLADRKVDGVVHLLPLSCMPETTIEPIINSICSKRNVPLLRLPIDETNSDANIATRIEAFVELIKRRKNHD